MPQRFRGNGGLLGGDSRPGGRILGRMVAAGLVAIALGATGWALLRLEEIAPVLGRLEERLSSLDEKIAGIAGRRPAAEKADTAGRTPPERPSPIGSPPEAGTPDGATAADRTERALARIEEALADLRAWAGRVGPPDETGCDGPPAVEAPPDFSVSLKPGSPTVEFGGMISVAWKTFPSRDRRGRGDWIGLFTLDAGNDSYRSYRMTTGEPSGAAQFDAPEETGEFEFRYLTAGHTLVGSPSAPFMVVANFTAALNAWPTSVAAGDKVTVAWSIYGVQERKEKGDWIGLFPSGSGNDYAPSGGTGGEGYQTYQMTGGEPSGQVELEVPSEPGNYELRYLTGGNFAIGESLAISAVPRSK